MLLAQLALVCCGTQSVPWAFVASVVAATPLFPHQLFSQVAWETVVAGYFDLPKSLARIATDREEGKVMNLIDGLILSRQRKATNSRDHIYGILGVINHAGIEPDYSKPTYGLYRDLVRHSIEKDLTLDILTACKRIGPESSFRPTWVPNRCLFVPESSYLLLNHRQFCHFQAGGLSTPKTSFSDDSSALTVQGLHFDDIELASPSNCLSPESKAFTVLKLDWELWASMLANSSTNAYGSLENQRRAFCATTVVGRDGEGKKEMFAEEGWQIFWHEGLGWVDQTKFSENEKAEREKKMQELVTRASGSIARGFDAGPRFFLTRQGYMGRGPEDLRQGDISASFLEEGYRFFFVQLQ